MKIGNKDYTRTELLQRIGNESQLGGTRHYVLSEGRAKGTSAVDFDTGAGLRFTVVPDRGMDISWATYKGVNLVYRTPNGEVNPAFYEPAGHGWLRTWFGGLLTTCGLTHLGDPGRDDAKELGLHGRYSTIPAKQVADRSGWRGDDCVMELTGIMEECALMEDKLRLTRTITSRIGGKSLLIHDLVENFGYRSSPFTILYHINPGFPLLDASSELVLRAVESTPYNERSEQARSTMFSFSDPIEAVQDNNFLHRLAPDGEGYARAALINPELLGGLGLYVRFDTRALPYLSEWKMMGQGDYVLGMEPCNVPCLNRAILRERGLLPFIKAGEVKEIGVEIGTLDGRAEIESFRASCLFTKKGRK